MRGLLISSLAALALASSNEKRSDTAATSVPCPQVQQVQHQAYLGGSLTGTQPMQVQAVEPPPVQTLQPCAPPVHYQPCAAAPQYHVVQRPIQVQAIQPIQVQAAQPVQVQAVQPRVQVQAVQPCVQVQAVQPEPCSSSQEHPNFQVQAVQPSYYYVPPFDQGTQPFQPLPYPPQQQPYPPQQQPYPPYPPQQGNSYTPYPYLPIPSIGSNPACCSGYQNTGTGIAATAGRIARYMVCPWSILGCLGSNCDNNNPSQGYPPSYGQTNGPPYTGAPPYYGQPNGPSSSLPPYTGAPPYYGQPNAPSPPPPSSPPQGQWYTTVVPVQQAQPPPPIAAPAPAPAAGPTEPRLFQPNAASLVPNYGLPSPY